ncbi:hypothetical protein J7E50_25845 [Pedobacter sp. ISL-68]|uniref:sigma factor-like helix-turn-helix DNA-binding protein n=1 Tax=unclassified Pedobacter TaxID=2628915 RepID=UPI001BEA3EF7|nr:MULTISPECIES: sigma factor-like helix-turn-helix DNA-binding protein [unclassified Pedobacter]MBT2564665.1 hypothetical protein [Pedobacter sp. ISL-64]MBT2593664.1 hypothetical protein [Pedobacter sp. ISL-68]
MLKAIRAQKTDRHFYIRLANITTEIITENPTLFKERQQLIEGIINQLPSDCREIFLMSRQDGLVYRQIAIKLNISEKTVEKKMSKSLKIIRSGLSMDLYLLILISHYLA